MKTLVVLSALASIAIAAPALPNGSIDGIKTVHQLQAAIKREKKSTQDLNIQEIDAPSQFVRSDLELPEVSARTFGLKKPIIVKKNHGYHLYRDSDEEQAQADSQEKCTKEVKVKLCDADHLAKSTNMMRSATNEDVAEPMTENEMEHSIQMAKEAVEHLQKLSQFKHVESGADAELHEDIEVVRQALEHIQKNFGNLESMSLKATTLNDAEALEDAHFKLANTNNGKMAQWKEAMDTIQKNVEIAKNIEDSFKSAGHENDPSDLTKNMKPNNLEKGKHIQESTHSKSTEEKLNEHDLAIAKNANSEQEKHVDEMTASASEPKESKIELHNNVKHEHNSQSDGIGIKPLEETTGKSHELFLKASELKNTAKHPEQKLESLLHTPASAAHDSLIEHDKDTSVKAAEHNIEGKKIAKSIPTEVSENTESLRESGVAQSKHIHIEHDADQVNHRDAKILTSEDTDEHMEHEKSAWKGIKDTSMLAKSTDNLATTDEEKISKPTTHSMDNGKSSDFDTMPFMKSSEHLGLKHEKLQKQDSTANMKSESLHSAHFKHNVETMKSADQMPRQSQQQKLMPAHKELGHPNQETTVMMKAADHANLQHQLQVPSNWQAQDNNNLQSAKMSSMKTAEPFQDNLKNHGQGMKPFFENHSHHSMTPHHIKSPHHVHSSGSHHFPRNQDNIMMHGKSVDMDSEVQASQINAEKKSAMEQNDMLQWKQHHGAARGAYGAGAYGVGAAGGAAGGSGAVGVFPQANVGGCAIPLLLSCNPSVVHGSLSKAPYGGAPAYRTGEDFKFHNKRELKNNEEIPSKKVKRTPTKILQKIPANVESKL